MDLLGESISSGGLLLSEEEIGENFFDLHTGLAGELFQKFINYHQRLALLIPDLGKHGERIQELALEHNTHPSIRFFSSQTKAEGWLKN